MPQNLYGFLFWKILLTKLGMLSLQNKEQNKCKYNVWLIGF